MQQLLNSEPVIMNDMKNPDTIHLTIHSPERTILEKMVSKVFTSEGVDECVDIRSGFVEIAYNDVIVCVEL